MTNRHLKIFSIVCETKSMTVAANRLYLTQPAVSKAIKDLEVYYGVQLFERYAKQLYLTEPGRLLFRYAKMILSLYEDVAESLRTDEGIVSIRIGVNISVGTELIRTYLKEFQKKYPKIKVRVWVNRSGVLTNLLEKHELDFCLLEDLIKTVNYVQEPFYKDKIVIVASALNSIVEEENLKFEDLKTQNFLLRETGAGVRDKFDYLSKLNDMKIEPLWESSSTKALVNAVRDNLGISVLPYLLVREYIESGELKELKVGDIQLERNLNIVYHQNKIFSTPELELIKIIKETKEF